MQKFYIFYTKLLCIWENCCIFAHFFGKHDTMFRRHRYYFLLFVLLLLVGCSEQNAPAPTSHRGQILKKELVKTLSISDIEALVGDSIDKSYLKYPVNCYRVFYSSVYEGDSITTAGLVLLPNDTLTADRSMCLYLHGTNWPIDKLAAQQKIPSNYFNNPRQSGGEVVTCGLPLASSGLAVMMPDYIGYGITADREHPFIYYPELRHANIDGLRALKNFLGRGGKQDVWLAGWSQGGGAALSLHYYIQTYDSDEFTVQSSSCLAGPYNFEGQLTTILKNKEMAPPPTPLCTWSVYVLNRFAVHRNPDQIFTFTVTDQVSAMMNFVGNIWDCFRPYFVQGLLNGEDLEWIQASKKNSFHDGWKPVGKVYLHHGTADNIVPYFNTRDAEAGLSAAGGDVTLYAYIGKSHFDVTPLYINNTLKDWGR